MTRYILEQQDTDGEWIVNHEGAATPTTKDGAALLLKLRAGDDRTGWRVTCLMDDNTFADVTMSIDAMIDDMETEREYQAMLDERHERQERHGWEQV